MVHGSEGIVLNLGPNGCIVLVSISGKASPNNAADTSGDNKVVMAQRRHLGANIYRAGCVNDHDQVTAALVKISQKKFIHTSAQEMVSPCL